MPYFPYPIFPAVQVPQSSLLSHSPHLSPYHLMCAIQKCSHLCWVLCTSGTLGCCSNASAVHWQKISGALRMPVPLLSDTSSPAEIVTAGLICPSVLQTSDLNPSTATCTQSVQLLCFAVYLISFSVILPVLLGLSICFSGHSYCNLFPGSISLAVSEVWNQRLNPSYLFSLHLNSSMFSNLVV